MACLRDDWVIYSNSEIHVNVNYKSCPKIKVNIGNKSIRDLDRFGIKENEVLKLEGEVLAAKSFLSLEIETNYEIVADIFIKI
jgi:hypothetical protein